MKVRASQGDTVDSLCWKFYGQTKGMNEIVLEANQGLAGIGAILPVGYEVNMPDSPPQVNSKQIIQLWE
jgi:phage tail protein X